MREKQKCRTYIKYFVLLALVDPAGQAAVSQGILDDVFVGLCTRLLVEFRSLEEKDTDVRSGLVLLMRMSDSTQGLLNTGILSIGGSGRGGGVVLPVLVFIPTARGGT